MLPVIKILQKNPREQVYQTIFFDRHIKFQYPLTSLLPFYFLEQIGVSDRNIYRVSKVGIHLSLCLTIYLTVLIAQKFRPKTADPARNKRDGRIVAFALIIASLFFFPLMRADFLGQIQTVLTFGFTAAFYLWIEGKEVPAGAIVGLMVLIKPQYGLFLLWAFLRKKYRVAFAGLVCALAGVLLSCLLFRLPNNLQYLQVLKFISDRGEAFCANQSANGLMNRLLFNGLNLGWDPASFAPPNSIVYFCTLASSLALMAIGLFFPWKRESRGGVADFACIILVSTMASPIAWEHHYAILLPILVWLWFANYAGKYSPGSTVALAAATLLISNNISSVSALATFPVLNILQSYLYLSAIVVLTLLLRIGYRLPGKNQQAPA
jgi:hypothetical protein